jgi:cation diffusion facilitator family transporter
MASSVSVVLAALVANGAIAILKFGGFLLTGSPSMLAETYHSISDTGNQVFLLIGIFYGRKRADEHHPFGYGKAEFFFSFLVSVMLFGIAGWESARHGIEAIRHGETSFSDEAQQLPLVDVAVQGVYVNYAILLGAIVFEAYALYKARAAMRKEIEKHDYDGYVEAFRKTSQTTVLTALTEDTIALSGLGIALAGIFLTRTTGDPIYDAASALLIGMMLMGFAAALAWENKRLLIGESLPREEETELRRIVAETDGVTAVVDLRTVFFGPGEVVVTADVAFEADLDTAGIDERITGIEDEIKSSIDRVTKVYIEPENPLGSDESPDERL